MRELTSTLLVSIVAVPAAAQTRHLDKIVCAAILATATPVAASATDYVTHCSATEGSARITITARYAADDATPGTYRPLGLRVESTDGGRNLMAGRPYPFDASVKMSTDKKVFTIGASGSDGSYLNVMHANGSHGLDYYTLVLAAHGSMPKYAHVYNAGECSFSSQ